MKLGNVFQPLESFDINFESRHEEILMNSVLIVDDDKRLERELENRYTFTDIVGKSKKIKD